MSSLHLLLTRKEQQDGLRIEEIDNIKLSNYHTEDKEREKKLIHKL